jgi:hypothetical protein
MRTGIVVAGVAVIGSVMPALAADVTPVYKAPTAATTGSWYIYADGGYERVALPGTNLGWHSTTTTGTFADVAKLQTLNPTLDAGRGGGAIGYFVPNTAYRLELGGSYVSGSGTSSGTRLNAPGEGWTSVLLNGSAQGSPFNCIRVAVVCNMNGSVHTSYDSWSLFGKASYDMKIEAATVTPSVAVFGGRTHDHQTFSQVFTESPFASGNYAADVQLRWHDVGARAGLNISAPVGSTPFTLGISGWAGGASRQVSLAASDVSVDTFFGTNSSAIAGSDRKTVLLGNLEGGVAYRVTSNINVRGFTGVNFDSAIPNLTAPSYGPSIGAQTPVPATLTYSSEANFYGGAGVIARY